MELKKKKSGLALLVLGLLVGGTAMVANSIHAAGVQTNSPVVAPTTQTAQGAIQTPGDTDNIQDPGGVEKPDVIQGQTTNKKSSIGHVEQESSTDSDGGTNEDTN
jgi:hypothetical protein